MRNISNLYKMTHGRIHVIWRTLLCDTFSMTSTALQQCDVIRVIHQTMRILVLDVMLIRVFDFWKVYPYWWDARGTWDGTSGWAGCCDQHKMRYCVGGCLNASWAAHCKSISFQMIIPFLVTLHLIHISWNVDGTNRTHRIYFSLENVVEKSRLVRIRITVTPQ